MPGAARRGFPSLAAMAAMAAVAAGGVLVAGIAAWWLPWPAAPRPSGAPDHRPPGATAPPSTGATRATAAAGGGPGCGAATDMPGWRQVAGPGPSARALHSAIFDPVGRRVIVFGGVRWDAVALGDVWAFSLESETWQELVVEPADGDAGDGSDGSDRARQPAPRWAPAALYDRPRGRMVLLFGNAGTASDEVWALDLQAVRWTRLGTGMPRPLARFDAAAATDGGERAWVYGGFPGPPLGLDTALGDLWELDLGTGRWRALPGGTAVPPPTTNAALGYHDGALYLVGGHDAHKVTPGTWRYDLARGRWQTLSPVGGPATWAHHARAVDDTCGRLLLVGGDNADERDVPYVEALEMGARPRYRRLPGEVPGVSRHHSALGFDPVSRRLVVFGGWRGSAQFLGDTWIYALGG
ncbi:MAG: hypothetical protein HY332_02585 [Chloroflexi bacterium]|nr:hypothetical protein [Chloroflexota bacterium]